MNFFRSSHGLRWLALGSAFFASLAVAQTTPAGLWQTVDDDSGQAKSLVRIVYDGGVLTGRIEKFLDPADALDAVCDRCTDERRNQRVLGLEILRQVRQAEGRPERWEGGDILDPENGKVYHVRLTLSADGRRLEVRGYIGMPLLGRTQVWRRVE